MTTAYRLSWNPRRPQNKDDINDILDEAKRTGEIVARWRCGNAKIRKGSRIYLLRLGKEPKGIIGAGTALSDAEKGEDPAVEVRFDHLQETPYIILDSLNAHPFNREKVDWANQSLAIRIPAGLWQELDAHLPSGGRAATQSGEGSTDDKGTNGDEAYRRAESLASGAGFGDPETNGLVESAAVIRVTDHYRKRGWKIMDVSRENRGYDLECIKGRETQHVEVKGVAGGRQEVILTENERRHATGDRDFVLAVVTSALLEPDLHLYSAEEMFSRFVITPMSHRAILRDQNDGQRQGKSRRGR